MVPFNPVAVLMRRMQNFAQKQKSMRSNTAPVARPTVSPAATMMANLQRMKLQAIRRRMQQMAKAPQHPQMQFPPRRQMPRMPIQFVRNMATARNMQVPRPAMLGQMRMPASRPVHSGMMRPRMMRPPGVMMMPRPPMMPSVMHARMMNMMSPVVRRMPLAPSSMMVSEDRRGSPNDIPVVGMPKIPFRDPRVTIQPGPNVRLSKLNFYT